MTFSKVGSQGGFPRWVPKVGSQSGFEIFIKFKNLLNLN